MTSGGAGGFRKAAKMGYTALICIGKVLRGSRFMEAVEVAGLWKQF